MKKGTFCESEYWMTRNDPRNYTVDDELDMIADRVNELELVLIPHILRLRYDSDGNPLQIGKHLQSQVVHFFTSFSHMKDFC